MEDKVVFDASAALAILNKEQGYEKAEQYLSEAIISAVNLSEVITIGLRHGLDMNDLKTVLSIFPIVISFDKSYSYLAASLEKKTKKNGLSFGDRACLVLALSYNIPVITADKIWKRLDIGVDIELIR